MPTGRSSAPRDGRLAVRAVLLSALLLLLPVLAAAQPFAQTITFAPPSSAIFGDAPLPLEATGGGSGNPVVFESLDVVNCSTSDTNGALLTFLGAGQCRIRATQAAGGDWLEATPVVGTITVNKAAQIITLDPMPAQIFREEPLPWPATGGASGNPLVYSSQPSNCFFTGNSATFLSVGSCTVLVTQAGNDDYHAGSAIGSFSIIKAPQVITSTMPASIPFVHGTTFPLAASGGASGAPVQFSGGGQPCLVSSEVALMLRPGQCIVLANQAGTANYEPAEETALVVTLLVTQAYIINIPDLVRVEGDEGFTVNVTVGDPVTAADALTLDVVSSAPAHVFANTSGAGEARVLHVSFDGQFHGDAALTLLLSDASGVVAQSVFDLQVLPVNDAPTLVVAGDVVRPQGATGADAQVGLFLSSVAGPLEDAQALSYDVGELYDPLDMVSGMAGAGDGVAFALSGRSGSALFTVTAQDDGGTENGGVDLSSPKQFRVRVGTGVMLEVVVVRRQPDARRRAALSAKGLPLVPYDITVTHHGPDAASVVLVRVPPPTGLLDVLWECVAASGCSPAQGSGGIETSMVLGVGESAALELTASHDAAFNFLEIRAEAAPGPGVTAIRSGDHRSVLIEPANAIGVAKSGFE